MKKIIKKIKRNQSGISVIELLVYISLVGIITIILTGFTSDVIKTSLHLSTINQVDQNARFLLSRISQEIKTAKEISPITDIHQLTFKDSGGNWVTISLTGEQINLGLTPLSTQAVRVTNLEFEKISPAVIEIRLSVAQKNPNAPERFRHQRNLSTIVAPRPQLY